MNWLYLRIYIILKKNWKIEEVRTFWKLCKLGIEKLLFLTVSRRLIYD